MQKLLYAIGGLLLINVIVIALTTNIHLGFMLQFLFAAFLITYGFFYRYFSRVLHIITISLGAIPIGFIMFLGIYGNLNSVTYEEDVLIVLGAGLIEDRVSPHLARRLDRAILYLESNPSAFVIVSGGLGDTQIISESRAMKYYLLDAGIAYERIVEEPLSRSTAENLLFSREILIDMFGGYGDVGVALISNDFHIFRANAIASEIGLSVNTLGATTPWYSFFINYFREIVAVVNFWIN